MTQPLPPDLPPKLTTRALLDHAQALAANGRLASALAVVRSALKAESLPHLPGERHRAYLLLAHLLRDTGRSTDAIDAYRQALALAPQDARAYLALTDLLHALGRDAAAVVVYREALAHLAPSPELHNNFGVSLQACGQAELAASQYRAAIALAAGFVPAWRNLARLLARGPHPQAAESVLAALGRLEPARREYALLRARLCPRVLSDQAEIPRLRERLAACLQALEAEGFVPDIALVDSWDLHFSPLLAYHGVDDTALKLRYAALWRKALPPQPKLNRRVGAQPHLGLVVTGHAGLFWRWLGPLLPWLAAQGARVSLFTLPAAAETLAKAGAAGLELLPPHLFGAADRIRRAGCDLLYYWESGSDSLNYFLPFLRLAPVQCHGFGWPITSGAPEMDVIFSAAAAEPEGGDSHYSERLVRLEPLLALAAAPPIPSRRRADFALPEQARLYLCCQDAAKLLPGWDALAAGVLALDPEGLLVLTAGPDAAVDARLLARLQSQPALAGRVQMVAVPAYDDYLGLIALADLMLDSTGFSGVTTTLEALLCGTPVLTLPGDFQRGRYALACYRTLGLNALAAVGVDDFVTQALPLASDRSLRPRLRTAALEMLANPRPIAALGQAMLNLLA